MGFPSDTPDCDSTIISDEMLQELQKTLDKDFMWIIVNLYNFLQDYDKVHAWLYNKNSMLGGITPMKLIAVGRGYKVKNFIEANQKANLP